MNLSSIESNLNQLKTLKICKSNVSFYLTNHYILLALTQKVLMLESTILTKTEIIYKKQDVESQLD